MSQCCEVKNHVAVMSICAPVEICEVLLCLYAVCGLHI